MQTSPNLHFQWNDPPLLRRFGTGVSLHGHTLHSRDSLGFLYNGGLRISALAALIRAGERRYRRIHGTDFDIVRGWWTPPLGPHEAWSIERAQLAALGLIPLISLTDHDDIEAPVSLQVLEECRQTPVSVEWTVPFGPTFFHLGVHNLPAAQSRMLFAQMDAYRQDPSGRQLLDIVRALHSHPEVLVVLNHPLWDEAAIGQLPHEEAAVALLRLLGPCVHALELNGLRPWRENRNVLRLASDVRKPAISGGDRHALEPSAIINVTNAASFDQFVDEVRCGSSNIVFLNHYREPHLLRVARNVIDILKTHERHANGWRLWSDRVFYQCDDGTVRSVTELFGRATPASFALLVDVLGMISGPGMRRVLCGVFPAEESFASETCSTAAVNTSLNCNTAVGFSSTNV